MKYLSGYLGEKLYITQPNIFKREYIFASSNEMIAKMYFPRLFSTTAIVEGFKEIYEIKKLNWWGIDLGIFQQGYEMPFAKYIKNNFWGTVGKIELPKGEALILKASTFRKSSKLYSLSDQLLISFNFKISFKEKISVAIENKSELVDQYPWVVMLAWYKLLQQRRNNK